MADTRRFPPADGALDAGVRVAVADSLAKALPEGGRVAIALSGGRDSVALLDAALATSAAQAGIVAFHVDHGLSVNARAWSQFCSELCATRGITCHVQRVQVKRGPRISVEAAARGARQAALDSLAREHGVAAVLLAHHADDQAETLLLQLFRGAGPRGLAAMPGACLRAGIWWLRPFLALPRARLDEYVAARALQYVDDDSNRDPRYRRNALRGAVVPSLREIAPGYPATLVRAAELQADAASLLDDLARIDAAESCDGATLDCAALARLDIRRARNLLRWFLREQRLPAPSRVRLAEVLRQVTSGGADSRIEISHAGAQLGVHRGRLVVHRTPVCPFAREWDGAEAIILPHGTLRFTRIRGTGIATRHVTAATVTIRSGVDGERFRLAGRSAHPVADLLREAGVPCWDRQGIPRIYCGDALAAVPLLGVGAEFTAAPGEPGLVPNWDASPRFA